MDRYMKIIGGADFMKFENLNPEDLSDIFKQAHTLRKMTDLTLEEMMSVASNQVSVINPEIVLGKSQNSSEFNRDFSQHDPDASYNFGQRFRNTRPTMEIQAEFKNSGDINDVQQII